MPDKVVIFPIVHWKAAHTNTQVSVFVLNWPWHLFQLTSVLRVLRICEWVAGWVGTHVSRHSK